MTRLRTRFLLATTLGILVSIVSQISVAQSLRGLKTVTILVEALSQDEADCGVTTDALRTAVEYVLQQSRLRTVNNVGDGQGYLYLQVSALPSSQVCAGSITMSFRTVVQGNTPYGQIQNIVEVYSKNTVLLGPTGNFGKLVNEQVETLTKMFVVVWAKDNPL